MDMYPSDAYYVFAGENEDEILGKAKEFETHMMENYSGGTTTFVKLLSKEDARSWYDHEIQLVKSGNYSQEEKDEAIDKLEQEFHEIYG